MKQQSIGRGNRHEGDNGKEDSAEDGKFRWHANSYDVMRKMND